MRVNLNGSMLFERLDQMDQTEVAMQVMELAQHASSNTLHQIYNAGMYLMTDPAISNVRNKLISIGQDVLIAGAGVMVVAAGIFIIIGLKREGMRRFFDQIQGLAVGLIGPAIIGGIAMFFITIAKSLTA